MRKTGFFIGIWGVLMLIAVSNGWGLVEKPAPGVLWEENFQSIEGWKVNKETTVLKSSPEGGILRDKSGRNYSGIGRYVPYDLQNYPYFQVRLGKMEAHPWAGIGLKNASGGGKSFMNRGYLPGLYVFDLRQFQPQLRGRSGKFALTIYVFGSKKTGIGPVNIIKNMRMTAEAPNRIDFIPQGKIRDRVLRPGDSLKIEVRLKDPAEDVTLDFFHQTKRRPFSFDGYSHKQLHQVDKEGKIWITDNITLTKAVIPFQGRGSSVLVTANIQGGKISEIHTTIPDDIGKGKTANRTQKLSKTLKNSPKIIQAVEISTPPRIDGRLNDPAWEKASIGKDFTLLNSGKLPFQKTEFRVLSDGNFLYLGITAFESQMGKLKAAETRRDGRVWADDALEIFLAPAGSDSYFQFVVNTLNTQFDSAFTANAGDKIGDRGWNIPWVSKIYKGPNFWSAEIAIPFSYLRLSRGVKKEWGFNIDRDRYAGGVTELSSWVPLKGGFHQPKKFGRLTLDVDLQPFFIVVGKPEYKIIPHSKGYQLLLSFPVKNQTGRRQKVLVRAQLENLKGGEKKETSARYDLAVSKEETLKLSPVNLSRLGDYKLRFEVISRDKDRLLMGGQWHLRLEYNPLTAKWLVPAYRNAVFPTQKIKTITAEVNAHASISGSSLLIARLKSKEGVEIISRSLKNPKSPLKLNFERGRLKYGTYALKIELREKGKTIGRTELPLYVLPPAPGSEVRIDKFGNTLVNGKLFLPYGWYGFEWNDAKPEGPGVLPGRHYNTLQLDPGSIRHYKPEMPKEVMVIAWIHGIVAGAPESRTGPLSEETKKKLKKAVESLKDYPNLLAYYLADEPEIKPISPSYLEEVYQFIRQLDPYHPCIVLDDSLEGIRKYWRAADILMPDPYIAPVKGKPAHITKVGRFMDQIYKVTKGEKAAWVLLQGCNLGDFGAGSLTARPPSWPEMRAQTYLAIVHGAKGIGYFWYEGHLNYPYLRFGLPYLGEELNYLKPAILSSQSFALKSSVPQIEVMGKIYRRKLFIIAVNTQPKGIKANLTSSSFKRTKELKVMREARKVKITKDTFSDYFSPFAVHVYTTGKIPPLKTLAAIQEELDLKEAALQKPGNLAFEGRGTQIRVSHAYGGIGRASDVIDGVERGHGWRIDPRPSFGAFNDKPNWLEISFPKKEKIHKVVITAINLHNYKITYWDGRNWRTLVRAEGVSKLVRTHTFPPVVTLKIRLVVPPNQSADVSEIEVY